MANSDFGFLYFILNARYDSNMGFSNGGIGQWVWAFPFFLCIYGRTGLRAEFV